MHIFLIDLCTILSNFVATDFYTFLDRPSEKPQFYKRGGGGFISTLGFINLIKYSHHLIDVRSSLNSYDSEEREAVRHELKVE